MNDNDDSQIKAEIDGIMQGVKNIMKKIDALTPNEALEQDPIEDQVENPDSSNNSLAGKD